MKPGRRIPLRLGVLLVGLIGALSGCRQPASSSPWGVVFFGGEETRGRLYFYDFATGEAQPLTPSEQFLAPSYPHLVSWSEKCQCFAYVVGYGPRAELYVLRQNGKSEALTQNEWEDSNPQWSPDGQQLAFLSREEDGMLRAYVMKYPEGNTRRLLKDETLLVSDFRWAFNGKKVAAVIAYSDKRFQFPSQTLIIADVGTGEVIHKLDENGVIDKPTWSPSGNQIAYIVHTKEKHELKIWDLRSNVIRSLTDRQDIWFAEWSPDGRYLAFLAGTLEGKDLRLHLYTIRADGTNLQDLTPPDIDLVMARPGLWSPDSTCLLVSAFERSGGWGVRIISRDSGENVKISQDFPFAISLVWATTPDFSCESVMK